MSRNGLKVILGIGFLKISDMGIEIYIIVRYYYIKNSDLNISEFQNSYKLLRNSEIFIISSTLITEYADYTIHAIQTFENKDRKHIMIKNFLRFLKQQIKICCFSANRKYRIRGKELFSKCQRFWESKTLYLILNITRKTIFVKYCFQNLKNFLNLKIYKFCSKKMRPKESALILNESH